jgi:DHA3 family macrolide efflux protein-like MFS transporter
VLIKTHRDFRYLWLAQLVSQLGDKIYALTLSWWVLELTVSPENPKGDPARVGYMMAVGALAATFFGPWLGTLADRFPRRFLMIAADLARAGLCGFLAFLAFTEQGNMPALYFTVFLISVFNLLFNPATHAILGSLVEDEEMQEALSLQQITHDLCNVLGAAAGGMLVAALGVKLGLTVNAASFLLSAFFITLIHRREAPHPPEQQEQDQGGGLGFLKSQPTILGLLVIFSIANLFLVPLFVLIPAISKLVLNGTAATLGLMEGALAVGSITTTAVVLKLSFKKRWRSLTAAIVLNGAMLAVMATSQTAAPMALSLAVIGGCLATVNVQFICMLQLLSPDHLKGRVFSLVETIATGCFPISYFLAGLAADHLALSSIFAVCGAGVMLAGLLVPLVPGIREV